MAKIGYLGDILFEVNPDKQMTPFNVQWSGSARYATHQRHLNNALTEFAGLDPDKMTLEIRLAAELGIDVMAELGKIWKYQREAAAIPLVIGEKIYGKFRWTIQKHNMKFKHYDGEGNLTAADVALTLLEHIQKDMKGYL